MALSKMHYQIIAARMRDVRIDIAKAESADDALGAFDRFTAALEGDFETDNRNFNRELFERAVREEGM